MKASGMASDIAPNPTATGQQAVAGHEPTVQLEVHRPVQDEEQGHGADHEAEGTDSRVSW